MTFLAAAPAANTVVTGVLGFLVVAAMGLALFFLLRSMNKQLRKVAPGPRWREQGRDGRPGAGVAAGRLHDRAARLELAGTLGPLHHGQPDPVLDRAAGVQVLELGEDRAGYVA